MIFNEMMPELTAEEKRVRDRRLYENNRRAFWESLYPTQTTVVTPPAILVASDFKRGIPCS